MPCRVAQLDRELHRGAFQQRVLERRDGDGGDRLAAHGFPSAGRGAAGRRAAQMIRRLSRDRRRVEAERPVPNLECDGAGRDLAGADAISRCRVVPSSVGRLADTDLVGAARESRSALREDVRPRVVADRIDVLLRPVPDPGDVHPDDRGTAHREAHRRRFVCPDLDVAGIRSRDGAIRGQAGQQRAVASGRQAGNRAAAVHRNGHSRTAIEGDRVAVGIQVRASGDDRKSHIAEPHDHGVAARDGQRRQYQNRDGLDAHVVSSV